MVRYMDGDIHMHVDGLAHWGLQAGHGSPAVGPAQVFPSLDDLKKKKLRLDHPISLPVLRNNVALKAGDELCVYSVKKETERGEPLRAVPTKRQRKS